MPRCISGFPSAPVEEMLANGELPSVSAGCRRMLDIHDLDTGIEGNKR
jgi:hypothetical protein